MSTIEETVRRALAERGLSSYVQSAGPAIDALVQRERGIAAKLIDYARTETDIDDDEVREFLESTGMAVPEPEPELEPRVDGELGQVLEALQAIATKVDSLTRYARANGYEG
jgi:hypothetical protein